VVPKLGPAVVYQVVVAVIVNSTTLVAFCVKVTVP
jgi:hypothetical protein